jgi:hypothetical protein
MPAQLEDLAPLGGVQLPTRALKPVELEESATPQDLGLAVPAAALVAQTLGCRAPVRIAFEARASLSLQLKFALYGVLYSRSDLALDALAQHQPPHRSACR